MTKAAYAERRCRRLASVRVEAAPQQKKKENEGSGSRTAGGPLNASGESRMHAGGWVAQARAERGPTKNATASARGFAAAATTTMLTHGWVHSRWAEDGMARHLPEWAVKNCRLPRDQPPHLRGGGARALAEWSVQPPLPRRVRKGADPACHFRPLRCIACYVEFKYKRGGTRAGASRATTHVSSN